MQLDLGSLKSVRSFAETFLKTEPRLDLLINNAGIYMPGTTEDGLGMMFSVNHIGPFLLTNLLVDRMKECGPSRVVNVSSIGHNFGTIDFNCLSTHKELGVGNSATDVFNIYANSKLCNVLFTHELAKRLQGTNVTCYTLHPGIYMPGTTEDGLGMMFSVNHIGPFLLTNLLVDRMKECGPSRVVNVSSIGHNFGTIDFNCLSTHKELGVGNSATDVFNIYANSKLCNVLFTHELAKRLQGTNVTCYTLHPGAINSELFRNVSKVFMILMKPFLMFFFKDTVAGSQTTLHCALQEGLEPLSGCYFSNCTVRNLYAKARDNAVAKKLWEVSESLSGLSS